MCTVHLIIFLLMNHFCSLFYKHFCPQIACIQYDLMICEFFFFN
jgi:hypothetical protein